MKKLEKMVKAMWLTNREQLGLTLTELMTEQCKAALTAADIIILPSDEIPIEGDLVRFELTMMGGAGGCVSYLKYYKGIEEELGGVIETSEIITRGNNRVIPEVSNGK